MTVGKPSQTGASAPTASSSPGGADFGSCSTPEIEFGVGFDNRKETSFRPVDSSRHLSSSLEASPLRPLYPASYPHGSAQNVNIITRKPLIARNQHARVITSFASEFICDSLTNTCKANQAAKDLCATARTAASSATAGTGAQADAFNGVFGIETV